MGDCAILKGKNTVFALATVIAEITECGNIVKNKLNQTILKAYSSSAQVLKC